MKAADLFSHKPARMAAVGVSCVLAVVYLFTFLITPLMMGLAPSRGHDFRVYYAAGARFRQGFDVYRDDAGQPINAEDYVYIYPPLFAALMSPLSQLPFDQALTWWTAFNFAATALSVVLLVHGSAPRDRDLKYAAVISWLALSFPFLATIGYGQTNALILLLLVAGLRWGARYPAAAGALLGLATAIKVVPVVPLAWLARQRPRSVAPPAGAVLVASAILLHEQFSYFISERLLFIASRDTHRLFNQSLQVFVRRLLSDTADTACLINHPAASRLLAVGSMVGIFVLALLVLSVRARDARQMELGFSVLLLATFLLPKIVMFHYFIFCIIPMIVMWDALTARARTRARLTRSWTILIAMLLLLWPSFTPFVETAIRPWLRTAIGPLLASYSTIGIMLLFCCNLSLWRDAQSPSAEVGA